MDASSGAPAPDAATEQQSDDHVGELAPDATVAPPDASDPELDPPDAALPTEWPATVAEGNEIHFGPIPTMPRDEQTVCSVVDLGNEQPMFVRELSVSLGSGSHHLIAYRVEDELQALPQPCSPSLQNERMLFIAQSHESALRYPDAAALVLQAHQRVRIEVHYFNGTEAPLGVGATLRFTPHEGDTSAVLPVKTRFTGDLSLTVPVGASTDTGYFPMNAGERYFALTTHTHRLGVLSTLHRATSLGDAAPKLLHTSDSWSEPPLTTFDPPITFAGDGLKLTCNYENTTDSQVNFGTSALSEMCFFWGYYY